jgi:hypothetical protein
LARKTSSGFCGDDVCGNPGRQRDPHRRLGQCGERRHLRVPWQAGVIRDLDDYIYSVPYVEDNEKIFLKTIIPNGKATKKYFGVKK